MGSSTRIYPRPNITPARAGCRYRAPLTPQNEPVAPVVSEEIVSEKPASTVDNLSEDLKQDVKSVLEYMDKLLINLPEEKIKEFAASDHFEVYRKLFSELGLE